VNSLVRGIAMEDKIKVWKKGTYQIMTIITACYLEENTGTISVPDPVICFLQRQP